MNVNTTSKIAYNYDYIMISPSKFCIQNEQKTLFSDLMHLFNSCNLLNVIEIYSLSNMKAFIYLRHNKHSLMKEIASLFLTKNIIGITTLNIIPAAKS